MFKIDNIEIKNGLFLAPMEDVTNLAFRRLCKEYGADVVYTEFVNSDGLIRNNKKTAEKMVIRDSERPVGIQIYGSDIEAMVGAATMADSENPDLIDINAGCWVKKVAKRGAGAGLLKDPPYLEKMVREVVDAVSKPVTVKTRIGWDEDSILIEEVARRVEDAGAKALTIHCRTRSQGHSGEPDWSWIGKIKKIVDIPIILNGGIWKAEDVKRAFDQTGADGVMIARGAIGNPWIFRQSRELIDKGIEPTEISVKERVETAIQHLKYELEERELRQVIFPFRKYWSGYLKGFHGVSKVRQALMQQLTYEGVEETLMEYLEWYSKYEEELSSQSSEAQE